MTLHEQLQVVFREVFDDDGMEITDGMNAADVEEWDSVTHVSLLFAVEERFGVRFPDDRLGSMENVGDMKQTLADLGAT